MGRVWIHEKKKEQTTSSLLSSRRVERIAENQYLQTALLGKGEIGAARLDE